MPLAAKTASPPHVLVAAIADAVEIRKQVGRAEPEGRRERLLAPEHAMLEADLGHVTVLKNALRLGEVPKDGVGGVREREGDAALQKVRRNAEDDVIDKICGTKPMQLAREPFCEIGKA